MVPQDPPTSSPLVGFIQEVADFQAHQFQALVGLRPSSELRRLLDGATLVSDRAGTFEGKAVPTVVFHPVPDLDDEDRKSVNKFEETVTLRLDGGGLPVSLDRSTELKVSKLLISFSVTPKGFEVVHPRAGPPGDD